NAAGTRCAATQPRKMRALSVELTGEITISVRAKLLSKTMAATRACRVVSRTMRAATATNAPNRTCDSAVIAKATPATKALQIPLPPAVASVARKATVSGSTNHDGFQI